MKTLLFTGAVLAAVVAGPAAAATHGCTSAMEEKAETAVDYIKTWPQLLSWYRSYQLCDNGAPAEGVSDAVSKLMTRGWSGVVTVRDELRGEKGFATFVVRHVDTTWSWDELRPARDNAGKRCPSGLETFCAAVVREVDRADQETKANR